MQEYELDKTYQRGARGKGVRKIQEWLSLHDIQVVIDGDFGPATEAAVKAFQEAAGIRRDGIVGPSTWQHLVRPMLNALQPIEDIDALGDLLVAYARQHLAEHPREVGGQNCGPWVRLYMSGHDGTQWAWCAGFVSYLLRQACDTLSISPPLQGSFSCDSLAAQARAAGLFVSESQAKDRSNVPPGSLFLNRRTSTDWTHTGLVITADDEVFHSIEGNTNDEGSREGYEVCQRTRGYSRKDFIAI